MKTSTTFLVLLCTLFQSLQAYCVYNNTSDKTVSLQQTWLHSSASWFSLFKIGVMKPTEKQCCPYTNTDCSQSGTKDENLSMKITVWGDGGNNGYITAFPSGGWIDINDRRLDPNDTSGKSVRIIAYNADGSLYDPDCSKGGNSCEI